MGNDQSGVRSRSQGSKELNSPTISMGVPASFSFLARKRNSTKSLLSTSIVVVNDGASTSASISDVNAELDLRRIKEIPHFLPLMQGVLPGYRDLPEILLKIDPRPIYRFLQRLQQHFRECTEAVTTEQGRIFAHIVEIDQLALSLVKKVTNSNKKLDVLGNELKKVVVISEQIDTAQILFKELSRCAESLNQLLPLEEQLSPLSITFKPILEQKVKKHSQTNDEELGWTRDNEGRSFLAGRVNECRVVDSDCF
uniref:BLOC-1-related complex subunit 5 n=1 Tax=Meloidogyne floridensis TaxID=298350 RepID=A0A915PDP1_9BILA